MHSVDIRIQGCSRCAGLLIFLRNGFASLFGLFQKSVQPFSRPFSSPLSQRNVVVRGVENGGNTCTISVLLQEFAALPKFYDVFLNISLRRGMDESECHYSLRKNLQTHLKQCISKLRKGDLVDKKQVIHLSHLLLRLGWQRDVISCWRRILHRWAPGIFPLPLSDPYKLYDKILSLYPETSHSPHKIALLARTSFVSQQLFDQRAFSGTNDDSILWRVSEDPYKEILLEEHLQVSHRLLTLKLVHVYQETPQGKHVVVYRKEGKQWICCDDAHEYLAAVLPSTKIYATVYDSQFMPT